MVISSLLALIVKLWLPASLALYLKRPLLVFYNKADEKGIFS